MPKVCRAAARGAPSPVIRNRKRAFDCTVSGVLLDK